MTANRNDFIILNKKLEKYARVLENNLAISLDIPIKEKCRLGFYIYVLENVCEESDILRISDWIIDTNFNKICYSLNIEDFGIDAIFIDKESFNLKLFNFKYRESFNPDRTQSLNDNFTSTKFLNLARNGDISDYKRLPDKLRAYVEEVHEILNHPREEWKVELYQVSNEAKEVKELNKELKYLSEQYAIEIIALALPTLTEYMSIRPEAINSEIILDSQAVMSYSESEKTSAKSFIVRMKCSELLRITCNSKELREQVNLEDSEPLSGAYLDFGVLFDNVRGLVKKSKYNENIAKTLKQEPKKFFMYNNGITFVANSIISKELPGKKALKLEINKFQVVNGGQTLRTIHEFNRQCTDNLEKYLYDAEVLVRIFMTDEESNEAHKIAEYTNSQNAIKSVDLKSLSSEQIIIERYLDEHNIAYARKSGDTGPDDKKDYRYIINMENFGKILKAMSGHPEKSTNSLKDIFEKDYQSLFIDNFNLESAPRLIEKYFKTIQKYKDIKIRGNQLKYFYTMFFSSKYSNINEEKIISLLESTLDNYLRKNETTAVKALGSTGFKNEYEKNLKKYIP